jgi:hypothetical protein
MPIRPEDDATSTVSGAVALASQKYKGFNINPSAALIKATLINGAVPLYPYTFPGNEQGWGRLNINNSLYGNWVYVMPEMLGMERQWNKRLLFQMVQFRLSQLLLG